MHMQAPSVPVQHANRAAHAESIGNKSAVSKQAKLARKVESD